MEKDFDTWNQSKKKLDGKNSSEFIKVGQIWWCSLGINIGHEINGKNHLFERPVLVLKKWNENMFLGVPLTTQKNDSRWVMDISKDQNHQRFAVLSQIRTLDAKRFLRKIQRNFPREIIQQILHRIFSGTTEPPCGGSSGAAPSLARHEYLDYTRAITSMQDTYPQKKQGTLHPLTILTNQAVEIFQGLGFEIAIGPEMETEWHNFDALNVPADHPARDMQDTFWIKNEQGKLLRTHTSPMQIRYMENLAKTEKNPPFAIVVPGKTFRNEATDSGHEMQFHQIEGLMVGENISLANLKAILLETFKQLLGSEVQIRMRPSFFPFVEPGVEVDIFFNGKWFEVLGAGMVHPNVLKNVGIDATKYSGFAFGMGIERLTMIKFGIPDIRLFSRGDLRLNQF